MNFSQLGRMQPIVNSSVQKKTADDYKSLKQCSSTSERKPNKPGTNSVSCKLPEKKKRLIEVVESIVNYHSTVTAGAPRYVISYINS